MATRKKTTPKSKKTTNKRTTRRGVAPADSPTVQLLAISFMILSMAFAVIAFGYYG